MCKKDAVWDQSSTQWNKNSYAGSCCERYEKSRETRERKAASKRLGESFTRVPGLQTKWTRGFGAVFRKGTKNDYKGGDTKQADRMQTTTNAALMPAAGL